MSFHLKGILVRSDAANGRTASDYLAGPTNLGTLDPHYNDVRGLLFVNDTAAVPEAATWAMMVVGFGLAGNALHERIAKVTFA